MSARERWSDLPTRTRVALAVAAVALVAATTLAGATLASDDGDGATAPVPPTTTVTTSPPSSTAAPTTTRAAPSTTTAPAPSTAAPSPPPTAVSTTTTTTAATEPTPEDAPAPEPAATDPCASSGPPTLAPPFAPDVTDAGVGTWTTVGSLTGSCDGSSAEFTTSGVDARLRLRSDAPSFVVYLVDAVEGREATAGFADADCAGPCREVQAVVNEAGRYRLEVEADGGPWEVWLDELRPAATPAQSGPTRGGPATGTAS